MKISANEIYDWRDECRKPEIQVDALRLKEVINEADVFQIFRAYVNYVLLHNEHHEDLEREVCARLTQIDGVYQDILLNAHIYDTGSGDDFEENGVTHDALFGYITSEKPIELNWELTYRYLLLFSQLEFHSSGKAPDLEIPKGFYGNHEDYILTKFTEAIDCIMNCK